MNEVLVVIGVGGMGETIARRQAPGKTTLLADFNENATTALADRMRDDGFEVETQRVDVSSRESLTALAGRAVELGRISQVVHTAGLSPTQASVEAVLNVDLVGVALMLEVFGAVIAAGGSGVVISSSSAYLVPQLTQEQAALIRSTPAELLPALPFIAEIEDAGMAYGLSKLANQVQVQHASSSWGKRSARVNTISPGVISTAMGRQELAGESGAFMQGMVNFSGTGRLGTPSDIADGATFLLGQQASFITGIDLLIDGGAVAAVATGLVPTNGLPLFD